MAIKPPQKTQTSLTFADIVLGADAETIKAAYDAKVKIDVLLAERQELYERIAQLEGEIDDIMGDQGVFIFPAPPCPVYGFDQTVKKVKPRPKKTSEEEVATKEVIENDETISSPSNGSITENE